MSDVERRLEIGRGGPGGQRLSKELLIIESQDGMINLFHEWHQNRKVHRLQEGAAGLPSTMNRTGNFRPAGR